MTENETELASVLVAFDYMMAQVDSETRLLERKKALLWRLRFQCLANPTAVVPAGFTAEEGAFMEKNLTSTSSMAEKMMLASMAPTAHQNDELAYWKARRAGAFDTAVGQHVIVHGGKVHGPFETEEAAIRCAVALRARVFMTRVGHESDVLEM